MHVAVRHICYIACTCRRNDTNIGSNTISFWTGCFDRYNQDVHCVIHNVIDEVLETGSQSKTRTILYHGEKELIRKYYITNSSPNFS